MLWSCQGSIIGRLAESWQSATYSEVVGTWLCGIQITLIWRRFVMSEWVWTTDVHLSERSFNRCWETLRQSDGGGVGKWCSQISSSSNCWRAADTANRWLLDGKIWVLNQSGLLKVGITFQNPDDQLSNPTVQRGGGVIAQVMDDRHVTRRGSFSGSKKGWLGWSKITVHMTCHCRNAKLLSLTVLAMDRRFIYLMVMMINDWERKPAQVDRNFHELADSGRQIGDHHPWHDWSPPSLRVGVCYGDTGGLASPAVTGIVQRSRTCPSSAPPWLWT